MTIRWILISNASEASLYTNGETSGQLALLRSFEHPLSRAKNRDLTTDINGRKPGGGGNAGRPGAEPETMPKEVEHQRFARELAMEVRAGLSRRAYETLVISAPPHFLGLLRDKLSTEVRKHVELTIDKDLTHLDQRALSETVHEALRA